jgi:hypothetical protein
MVMQTSEVRVRVDEGFFGLETPDARPWRFLAEESPLKPLRRLLTMG